MPTLIPAMGGLPLQASSPPSGVQYGSKGGGASATNTSPMTWTHTIEATATALVVWASVGYNTSLTQSCTVGGVAMTDVSPAVYSTTSGTYQILCFTLLNPPTGSKTLSLTVSSGTGLYVIANSFTYLNVSSLGALTSNTGSSTALSVSVPSVGPYDGVSACFAGSASSITLSGFTGGLERYNSPFVSGTNYAISVGDEWGATPTAPFAVTSSATTAWGAAGLRMIH